MIESFSNKNATTVELKSNIPLRLNSYDFAVLLASIPLKTMVQKSFSISSPGNWLVSWSLYI